MVADQLINLAFHGIGEPRRRIDDDESTYWISAEFFDEVLGLVAGEKGVRLTFDDGNESDLTVALPALRARGLAAAFFPIAERLGQPGSVGRDALRQLVGAGMTVGSHGMRHRRWRRLTLTELSEELVEAREIIATAAGVPVRHAACPLGAYDRRVVSALHKLGYSTVYTSDRAAARADSWMQPRYSLRRTDDLATVQAILAARPSLARRFTAGVRVTAKRWR